jgi:hypothetical protein
MKIRLLLALAGSAISVAVPTFAQEQNTVDPEVRQQPPPMRLLAALMERLKKAISYH